MLTLLLIIVIVLYIWCINSYADECAWVFGVAGVIILGIMGILITSLLDAKLADKKIELYQEQNSKIEEQMEVAVKTYMEYEKETYTDLKVDSYIMIANKYPELKSDKLVQEQINLYMENNKKITQLKENKIDKSIYRFWLYFGK